MLQILFFYGQKNRTNQVRDRVCCAVQPIEHSLPYESVAAGSFGLPYDRIASGSYGCPILKTYWRVIAAHRASREQAAAIETMPGSSAVARIRKFT